MKIKPYLILVLGFFVITSCFSRRIEMIESTFGIRLPQNYNVLKNTTESTGFAGTDFEVNVKLKFKSKEFEQLENELFKIDSLKLNGKNIYLKNKANESGSLEIDRKNQLLIFRFIHL